MRAVSTIDPGATRRAATRSNFPDFLARNNETNYFHADEITLIGQLVKKVEVKLAGPTKLERQLCSLSDISLKLFSACQLGPTILRLAR